MPSLPRVLFVCGGNTCRSPMAQALAQRRLGNLTVVESAGVDAAKGCPAAPDAVSAMEELGIDLQLHTSRDIADIDLSQFDLVVSLSPVVAARLRSQYDLPSSRIKEFDVHDPYMQGIDAYRRCAAQLSSIIDEMFPTL